MKTLSIKTIWVDTDAEFTDELGEKVCHLADRLIEAAAAQLQIELTTAFPELMPTVKVRD